MQSTRTITTVMVAITVVATMCLIAGCGKNPQPGAGSNQPVTGSPPAFRPDGGAKSPLFPNLDTSRLGFPNGWKNFEQRIQDASNPVLGEGLRPDEIDTIAEQARGFAKSDRRGHAHGVTAIPTALILCAQARAKAGDHEAALKLLDEVRQYGGLFTNLLADSSFDEIRDSERFKELVAFAEAETNEEVYGSYLVRSPPLFPLDDLRQIAVTPPLPSSQALQGKVTVVYTGPQLTPDALSYLAEATEQGASVHAIVTQRSDAPKEVFMHIASIPPEQLIADQTAMTWFANRDGQVVAFLRPFSGPGFAKAIVAKLSSTEQAK